MSVLKGLYAHLNSDVEVTSAIGVYNFGSGSQPAIFTVYPPPRDSATPLVAIVQTGGNLIGRDRGTRGGEMLLDVFVWGDRNESGKATHDAAMAVWRSLDRAELTVEGYEAVYCLPDPPAWNEDPDGFPGYRLSTRVLLCEVSSTS